MRKTVLVDLDELTSLLLSAVDVSLKRAGVYHRSGLIGPDAVARVTAGLASRGLITTTAEEERE